MHEGALDIWRKIARSSGFYCAWHWGTLQFPRRRNWGIHSPGGMFRGLREVDFVYALTPCGRVCILSIANILGSRYSDVVGEEREFSSVWGSMFRAPLDSTY